MVQSRMSWLIVFLICSCTSGLQQVHESQACEKYRETAIQSFGSDYLTVYSPDKQHILCIRQLKPTKQLPSPPLSYFVYNCNENGIVFQEELPNGKISWVDNDHVKIQMFPGIIKNSDTKKSELPGYVLYVKTGRKIKLSTDLEK